ncbi:MAG: hypothetical protein N2443_02280 [Blastocatellia bacterium]|nr:hypothetical protein [Blastocatellia bacterium]MCX7751674.1 hypothetical protein [Blastocatellia bacterium]MDW8168773.1 hypothetical protein [Acidobacteriota bacterium]
MLANTTVKFASAALLIISGIGTTPFRFGEIRANRPTVTPVLGSSQSGIEPKVIEQKDRSGNVLARLRITPGTRPGEFRFEVEDFNQPIPARATGTGMISDTEVAVQFVESRSGTRLGLRAKANGGKSAEVRITLSLDRLSFNLVVDEKVQTLMNEVRNRAAGGASDADLIRLARQIEDALQIRTGYWPFIEHVRSSAAADTLTVIRSLIGTVSLEEVKHDPVLAVIWAASRFFTVASRSLSFSAVTLNLTTQGRIVKAVRSGGEGVLATQGSNCGPNISCTECFWLIGHFICGPLPALQEVLCWTMNFVEWLFCIP